MSEPRPHPTGQQLWWQLWLLLLAVLIVAYVAYNPPLSWFFARLKPLAFASVLAVSWCGLGWPLARWLLGDRTRLDVAVHSFAFGLGIQALVVFVPGVLGHLPAWLYAITTLIGLALFGSAVRSWLPLGLGYDTSDPRNVLAAMLAAATLLLLLPMAVAPATTTDALEYHLLVPASYLRLGAIEHIPSFLESNYPSLAEYLYLSTLSLADEITCKCIHLFCGLAALLALANLVRTVSPESNRWLPPALFLTMPVASLSMSWAWNDHIFTLFVLLTLTGLARYHATAQLAPTTATGEHYDLRALWAAGICLGLASATKYTCVMIFLTLSLVALHAIVRWRWRPSHLLRVLLPFALLSLIWAGKNFVFTGNPFYPFLNDVPWFHSEAWTPAAEQYFRGTLTRFELPEWTAATYLTFPFHLTLYPRVIDVHMGILPLAFLALTAVRSRTPGVALLKSYLVAFVMVWLLIQTEARSMLSMLAVLFALGCIGLEQSLWRRRELHRPIVLLLAAAAGTSLVITSLTVFLNFEPMRFLFGKESHAQYLTSHVRGQVLYDALNSADEGAVGTVLLVSLHAPYYLDRPVYFSSCCDPPVAERLVAGTGDVAELEARFRALGISHIAIAVAEYRGDHDNGLYSWPGADRERFEQLLHERCELVLRHGEDRLYRLGAPATALPTIPSPP